MYNSYSTTKLENVIETFNIKNLVKPIFKTTIFKKLLILNLCFQLDYRGALCEHDLSILNTFKYNILA